VVDGVGPDTGRVAAVLCSGRQGSGYLLSPTVVLTAAHVVAGAPLVTAIVPRGRIQTCTVVWASQDPACDVALLCAEEPLTSGTPATPWPVTSWGKVPPGEPVKDCQAIGYPAIAREGRWLDTEQLVGTLKPASGLLRGRLALDNVHTPPAPRRDGRSPWEGFSGAAVFAHGLLVGVAVTDSDGYPHSRIEVVPVAGLLDDIRFFGALKRHGCPVPTTGTAHPDAVFERRYAECLVARHSELAIYGLDLSHASEWPLDASYLSLEIEPPRDVPGGDLIPDLIARPLSGLAARPGPGPARHRTSAQRLRVPLRADESLSRHDKVLLRGVAGSGKTTLVQWLAVTAVRGAAAAEGPARLRDRVPFVLPLRSLSRGGDGLPAPEHFLSAVSFPIAGSQPSGWADRVLSERRGLLLVDGVDEIAESDRKKTRRWLKDLVAAYPGNLWLVTSRPSAVPDDWLARDGFTQLDLAPMHRDDVTAFVRRWHEATGADESLRDDLLTALRTKRDLARLVTNPLMCGLICALHRERRGYLPQGRKELYEAALRMLLERRDQERGVEESIGVQLTQAPQIRLLQKLAYWMIRNQSAEVSRARAVSIIADALPAVPQVAQLGDAEDVLLHLLLRSGLLRAPSVDAVEFVHRTFQDFLAAKAAVDEGDFGLLLHNARETQWEDVIRMAFAHARPKECAKLLDDLIRMEDRRVHLLAMACLEHATELDQDVRRRVEERASRVIPPRSFQEAAALREVGPMVLELLPGPERLTEGEAGYVLETAAGIADDAALPLLARFCASPWPRIRERVVDAWELFDAARYAQEVICRLPADDLLVVRDTDQLAALRHLGARRRLQLRGDMAGPELAAVPFSRSAHELVISRNRCLTDLAFLGEWTGLRRLAFENGTTGNPSAAGDWQTIADLPGLRELKTTGAALGQLPPGRLTVGLERLNLVGDIPCDDGTLAGLLEHFPDLSVLDLSEARPGRDLDLRAFTRLGGLRRLIVRTGTRITGHDQRSHFGVVETM
jgi:hypothetical protein